MKETLKNKICSKCKKQKQITEFNRDKRASDGCYSSCKECSNKTNKISYLNHKDSKKRYYKKNFEKLSEAKRKWQEKNINFTNNLERTFKCNICGEKGKTVRHHLIPKEYGDHSSDNLIELCIRCHNYFHKEAEKLLWEKIEDKKEIIKIIMERIKGRF